MLVDCHTHIDQFCDGEVTEVLGRAALSDVQVVVVAGTTLQSSSRAVRLSARFHQVFAGIGIHPMDLQGLLDREGYSQLDGLARSTDRVIAVSEIGLDFKEGMPDRAVQYQAFREQIRLARDRGLPIIFHSRQAHDETLRVLKEEMAYEVGGAMHYFQSDIWTARRAIDLGFYISIARPLLRSPELQEVVSILPLEKLVLETDSAPQPFKSKRNNWTEPRHVREIAILLSRLKNVSLDEVKDITTGNFLQMIGPKRDVVEQSIDTAVLVNSCGLSHNYYSGKDD